MTLKRVALGTLLLAFACFPVSAATFVLSPNGVDDTATLRAAFDTAAPGDTIQLAPGVFRISMLEVERFEGTLRGAGIDLTIIESVPNLPCSIAASTNTVPALLKFRESDITLSDLTFHITEFDPCDPYQPPGATRFFTHLPVVVMIRHRQ